MEFCEKSNSISGFVGDLRNIWRTILTSQNDDILQTLVCIIVKSLHFGYSCWRLLHDDVIKWKHFPRYWPFVRGIHRSPVNSPRKGQWRGALMFSLICSWLNSWINNGEASDLRRHRAHYDVIVMHNGDNKSGWLSVMVGNWADNQPSPKPMMTQFTVT